MVKMEKHLGMWIEEKLQKTVPVDWNAMKPTELKMYQQIQGMQPDPSAQLSKIMSIMQVQVGWQVFLKGTQQQN